MKSLAHLSVPLFRDVLCVSFGPLIHLVLPERDGLVQAGALLPHQLGERLGAQGRGWKQGALISLVDAIELLPVVLPWSMMKKFSL